MRFGIDEKATSPRRAALLAVAFERESVLNVIFAIWKLFYRQMNVWIFRDSWTFATIKTHDQLLRPIPLVYCSRWGWAMKQDDRKFVWLRQIRFDSLYIGEWWLLVVKLGRFCSIEVACCSHRDFPRRFPCNQQMQYSIASKWTFHCLLCISTIHFLLSWSDWRLNWMKLTKIKAWNDQNQNALLPCFFINPTLGGTIR